MYVMLRALKAATGAVISSREDGKANVCLKFDSNQCPM